MLLSSQTNIEDKILTHLTYGPKLIVDLIAILKKQRPGTTKQGVYNALRALKRDEVVVTHKKQASLNLAWVNKISAFTSQAQNFYLEGRLDSVCLKILEQGGKIQYFFKNPTLTDAFWCHAIYILLESVTSGQPVYLYNPHCWVYITRPESERGLRDYIINKKIQYLVAVHGKYPLDKYIINEFNGESSQYYMSETLPFKPDNYYFNVIGDYLIEVWEDHKLTTKIENLYKRITIVTEKEIEELKKIVKSSGRTKLVISKNPNKIQKYKRIFEKHFFIKKL